MGVIEWVETMRKKPVREKQRFVAGASVAVMAVITIVWFIFFFIHFFSEIKKQKDTPLNTANPTLPVPEGESITPPFSQP